MSIKASAAAAERREAHRKWQDRWLRSLRWCSCAKPKYRRMYLAQWYCLKCGRLQRPRWER